jgi:hypothetical protein
MGKRRSLDDDPSFNDLRERIARLETDMKWVKEIVKKVDSRTWYILACVIIGIVITIASKLT